MGIIQITKKYPFHLKCPEISRIYQNFTWNEILNDGNTPLFAAQIPESLHDAEPLLVIYLKKAVFSVFVRRKERGAIFADGRRSSLGEREVSAFRFRAKRE